MEKDRRLYIECLVTAIKKCGFLVEPGSNVFLGYLELNSDKQAIEQELNKEYEGISRDSFKSDIDLDKLRKEKNEMINSFINIVSEVDEENTIEVSFNDYSKEKFGSLFNYYRKKTDQVRDKPAVIYELRRNILLRLENIVETIAKKVLEISTLEKIQVTLRFEQRYNPDDLIIKKGVADACWDILDPYIKDPNNDINMSSAAIVNAVLTEYHIEKNMKIYP